ncbi:hypothetical protein [Micromonospora sp. WMMD975]|uniref:hypothetical protein n=1 Tax=Micromonospora sp. WMMD975 TaxID=3016087 RepID=UPI00249A34FD|nr:hypothetical protein [Micromonospora sp. WMMD975]WFE35974.1 hypothetical protein O7613_11510 [Micromonospora sp. WMMD975]
MVRDRGINRSAEPDRVGRERDGHKRVGRERDEHDRDERERDEHQRDGRGRHGVRPERG